MERSTEINELATALAKAQGRFLSAIKDSQAKIDSKKGEGSSYSYKYADLASIINASRLPMSENGLSVLQPSQTTLDGLLSVETILLHESGQWIASTMDYPIIGLSDVKKLGSLVTYLRRYALASMLGIVTDDDDGHDTHQANYARDNRSYSQNGHDDNRSYSGNGHDDQGQRRATPDRAQDHAPSKSTINEDFKKTTPGQVTPRSRRNPDPKSKEKVHLEGDKIGVRGIDLRYWDKVISGEVEKINQWLEAEKQANNLDKPERVIGDEQVANHILKKAVAAGAKNPRIDANGNEIKIKIGVVNRHLDSLYKMPDWRTWLREELKNYLRLYETRAYQTLQDSINGDSPEAPPDSPIPTTPTPTKTDPKNHAMIPDDEDDVAVVDDDHPDRWAPGRE